MGRKKKTYSFLDENAPKTTVIQFRLNHKERSELDRLSIKLGISKAEVYRRSIAEYYKKVFSEE